jgi:hypothetical protein
MGTCVRGASQTTMQPSRSQTTTNPSRLQRSWEVLTRSLVEVHREMGIPEAFQGRREYNRGWAEVGKYGWVWSAVFERGASGPHSRSAYHLPKGVPLAFCDERRRIRNDRQNLGITVISQFFFGENPICFSGKMTFPNATAGNGGEEKTAANSFRPNS